MHIEITVVCQRLYTVSSLCYLRHMYNNLQQPGSSFLFLALEKELEQIKDEVTDS